MSKKKRNRTGKRIRLRIVKSPRVGSDCSSVINRRYKDTIFRMLFSEREMLLSLYNGMAGTSYTDPGLLKIITLESAIYMKAKNDLAFVIDCSMWLFEHQASVNPNMPLRILGYTAEEYGILMAGENVFGTKQIKLPTPHFVVFYNGRTPQPERQILKLSDAFEIHEEEPWLELRVLVLNINEGYNEGIKEQCRELKEYMQFVTRVRKHSEGMPFDVAITQSVDECIAENILKEFLMRNRSKVMSTCLYAREFDEEAYQRSEREYARELGLEEGRTEGRAQGRAEGRVEGLAEGLAEGRREAVRDLIVLGISKEKILALGHTEEIYAEVAAEIAGKDTN